MFHQLKRHLFASATEDSQPSPTPRSATDLLGESAKQPVPPPRTVSVKRRLSNSTLADSWKSLDLTRITDRVMAMGMLWKQRTERSSHRNNLDEVALLLNHRWPRRYLIYDLSG